MPDKGLEAFGEEGGGDPEGVRTTVRLARDLSLADATMLGVGALLGGGIFVLPGIAAGVAGPGLFLALALNAIVTVPTLLVYAELASGFHDAGGGYLWIKDALNEPWGFLGGWMAWFSHAVACGVYALASSSYLLWLLQRYDLIPPGLNQELLVKVTAVAITGIFVAVNYRGVKQAARAENIVTVLVLGTLAVFLIFGFLAIAHHPEGLGQLHLDDTAKLLPNGFTGIFLAMGLTFIAFEGYEIIAQASEEVKRPKRNVPLASILSVVIVAPLLVLVAIVAIAAIQPTDGQESWQWLASHGELALVEAAGQFIPLGVGALVVLVGAMLSNITALNSTIYSSSRVSFAMGRDRVLPAFFARVDTRTQTPATSILFSGVLIAGMAATLPITDVAAAADIMFLLLFMMVNVSYIKLRRTKKHLDFGFRAPFFPWLPLIGIVAQLALAVALFLYSPTAWIAAVMWVGVGLIVHYGFARNLQPRPQPRTSLTFEVTSAEPRGYTILLPVHDPAQIPLLGPVARDLAIAKGASVTLLHVVTVPRTTVPSSARHLAEPLKPMMAQAGRFFPAGVPVHSVIKIAHDAAAAILETAEEEGADLLVLGWPRRAGLRGRVLGTTLDPVVREAPCDVAVFRPAPQGGEPKRMLVAARGRGKHAKLGAQLAASLAKTRGGDLVALTIVTPGGQAEPEARLASVIADAGIGPWDVRFKTLRASSAEAGLVQAAGPGDMLVLGASEEAALKSQLFGTLPERVTQRAHAAVLLVKRRTPALRMASRIARKGRAALDYLRPE